MKRIKSRRETQFKPAHQCSYVRESKGVTYSESRGMNVKYLLNLLQE